MLLRHYITPAAAGSFFVCALSGVALFFHFQPSFFRQTHEWAGLVFVAAALAHIINHRQGIVFYAKRITSASLMAALILGFVVFAVVTSSASGSNPKAVLQVLSQAPIKTLAPSFGTSPQQAVLRLKAKGIEAGADQTVGDIARKAQASPLDVLTILATTPAP